MLFSFDSQRRENQSYINTAWQKILRCSEVRTTNAADHVVIRDDDERHRILLFLQDTQKICGSTKVVLTPM